MRRPHSALLLITCTIKLFDATIPISLPVMPLFDATCTMNINSPPLTSPIQFAQSLKIYSTQDPASSLPHATVISFDFDTFNLICNKDSLSYNQTLCDYDALAAEFFKVDEIWSSKDLIKKVMKSLSKFQGWSVSKEKLSLRCNRSGNNNASRPYAKGPLRCGCTFGITLVCLEKSRYIPDGSTKYSYLTPSNTPHLIVNAVCMHGGNCVPGLQNRVATLQRGGRYVNDMPNSVCLPLPTSWRTLVGYLHPSSVAL